MCMFLLYQLVKMELHSLVRSKWIKKSAIQVGRGNWSKRGNYSKRWLKWAWSRAWFSVKPFFAGWQTSLSMRLPKLPGFKKPIMLQKRVTVINTDVLDKDIRIENASVVTMHLLTQLGYNKSWYIIKLLWSWSISKNLTFEWPFLYSQSAQEKIIQAWGSFV